MLQKFIPYIVIWGVIATAVLVMIVWRKTVARNEDDTLHLLHGDAVPQQAIVAHKLDFIDKWGKLLTIVAVVYALVLAAVYVYQGWVQATNVVPGA